MGDGGGARFTEYKWAHEQLEAEIDALGSDESEGEITDLPFKNVGQVTRFLDKRQLQIQRTMDRIEKAFPGNSVSRIQKCWPSISDASTLDRDRESGG